MNNLRTAAEVAADANSKVILALRALREVANEMLADAVDQEMENRAIRVDVYCEAIAQLDAQTVHHQSQLDTLVEMVTAIDVV